MDKLFEFLAAIACGISVYQHHYGGAAFMALCCIGCISERIEKAILSLKQEE